MRLARCASPPFLAHSRNESAAGARREPSSASTSLHTEEFHKPLHPQPDRGLFHVDALRGALGGIANSQTIPRYKALHPSSSESSPTWPHSIATKPEFTPYHFVRIGTPCHGMAPSTTSSDRPMTGRRLGGNMGSREATPTTARQGVAALMPKVKSDAQVSLQLSAHLLRLLTLVPQLATSFKTDLTKIRSLVTCAVCDQLLYEPWTLGCGHTYCYSVRIILKTTRRRANLVEVPLPMVRPRQAQKDLP